jgi:hypothetical protein
MLCCSPGATCMQKADEPAEHYWVLLGKDGEITRRKFKSRVFVDWSVMHHKEELDRFMAEIDAELAAADQKAAAMELPDAVAKPLLRVTYSHRLTDAVRRVTAAVKDRAFLVWRELPPSPR